MTSIFWHIAPARTAGLRMAPFIRVGAEGNQAKSMAKLTEYTRYADAQAHADSKGLWHLFRGNSDHFNIADECISRHADGSGRIAVRIAHADGTDTALSFDE